MEFFSTADVASAIKRSFDRIESSNPENTNQKGAFMTGYDKEMLEDKIDDLEQEQKNKPVKNLFVKKDKPKDDPKSEDKPDPVKTDNEDKPDPEPEEKDDSENESQDLVDAVEDVEPVSEGDEESLFEDLWKEDKKDSQNVGEE